MIEVDIHAERPGDEPAIRALTEAAFADMPFSDGDEHGLVDALRAADHLTVSLVATQDDALVGHIAFSPVTISDGSQDWFGLGPVSVTPALQRQGIGSALIERGLAALQKGRARGIVLLGSPIYYARFGFEHDPRLVYPGPPAEYFQRLVLAGEPPSGIVTYAPAFA